VNKKSQGNKGETIFQRKRGRALGIMKEVTGQLKNMGKQEGYV
jgi:hypothetical protein